MLCNVFCCWLVDKIMSPDHNNPPMRTHIFGFPAHITFNLKNLQHTLLASTMESHYPWWHNRHSRCLFLVTIIEHSPINHWLPMGTWYVTWYLLVAEISHHRWKYYPAATLTHLCLGWQHQRWSQPISCRNRGNNRQEGRLHDASNR